MITSEKTKAGVQYLSDFKSNDSPTVVYLHGSGQINKTLEAIKSTPFFKLFYTAFKDEFNFFFPLKIGGSGWEDYKEGKSSGARFILEIIELHKVDKIVPTGHSAGGTWATATSLQGLIKGFAPVAGRALDYKGVLALHGNGVQVNAWHGENDHGFVNNIDDGKQAIKWYKSGGGSPIFNILPGVGHGSDSIAYKPTSGLKAWIDSLFPVVEEKPGIYVNNIWMGYDSCDFQGNKIEFRQ